MEVEVSSAAWACPCAPWLMRRALAEIWPAEEATWTEASWMLSAMFRRLPTISLRLRPRVPTSSSESVSILTVRSPLATASEAWAMACRGLQPTTGQEPARGRPQGHEEQAHEQRLDQASVLEPGRPQPG